MTSTSATLFRAIIWAIAGASYSLIFFSMLSYFEQASGQPQWWQTIVSGTCAGALVAAAYSAKRVAIIGLLVGSIISHAHAVFAANVTKPGLLLSIAAVVGFLAGMVGSWFFERRHGALMVVTAGAIAGTVAGTLAVLLALAVPVLAKPGVICFLLVPSTGGLFYLLAIWAHQHKRHFLPHWLSVATVSAGISVVAAIGLWLLSLTLRFDLDPALKAAVESMFGTLPQVLAGGILGGACGGAALELLKVEWMTRLS